VLHLEGAAPAAWCARLERRAIAIPGVMALDTTGLINPDRAQYNLLKQEIERLSFPFEKGQAALALAERGRLADAAGRIDALLGLARRIGRAVIVRISGYADPSGAPEQNLKLSRDRADHVRAALAAHGIPESVMKICGEGSVGAEAGDASHQRRAVIHIDDGPGIGKTERRDDN
jgi:outer membrane protein OmpA-like peptidoglycan-associated protein